jgi:hypothetical protein
MKKKKENKSFEDKLIEIEDKLDKINNKYKLEKEKLSSLFKNELSTDFKGKYIKYSMFGSDSDSFTYMYVTNCYVSSRTDEVTTQYLYTMIGIGFSYSFSGYADDSYSEFNADYRVEIPFITYDEFISNIKKKVIEITKDEFDLKLSEMCSGTSHEINSWIEYITTKKEQS